MAKGQKYGGRQTGSQNVHTRKIKDNIVAVFDGLGGYEAMLKWAKKNRTLFYQMYARLAPAEIHGKGFTPPPPPKDKPESDRDLARKVLFVLSSGAHEAETLLKNLDKTNPQ